MKKAIILSVLLLITYKGFSQEYYQAIGLRGGVTSGLTYKKFLTDIKSMEAIMSFRKEGLQITVVRQFHELSLLQYSDNIYFMHGYGGHIGFIYAQSDEFLFFKKIIKENKKGFAPVLGVDAYLGFEYRADELPLTIGIDYKPFIEFSMLPFKMNIWDFAFYVKYTF